MEMDTALDILKSALLLERRGRAFYGKVAEQTRQPAVKAFFTLMAEEEEEHIEVLTEQYRTFKERSSFAATEQSHGPSPDLASAVLNEQVKDQIAAAGFEAAAIAAALTMERNAVRAYSERAETSDDPEEKALYRWLAEWETEHLEFLAKVDRELIEEVWDDSHFWPL